MKRRAGFTAEELIVCLGMILVGMGVVWVTVSKAAPRARAESCASNVHQIGVAMRMYGNDNDGRMPGASAGMPSGEWSAEQPPPCCEPSPPPDEQPPEGRVFVPEREGEVRAVAEALQVYVKNQQIMRCPSAPRQEAPRREESESGEKSPEPEREQWFQVDYVFNTAARTDDTPQTLLAADNAAARHVSRTWNTVRLDGAVVRLPAARWDEYWRSGPPDWREEGMMDYGPPAE